MFSVDMNAYNRFTNLDGLTYRIVDFLAKSESKHADYLWKILKYDSEDCLSQPTLSYKERMDLLYKNNGDASVKRVFLSPYIDDGWENQTSHLHIYINSIVPKNHLTSTVNIAIECIVHNKISNITGDANEFNSESNPSELGEDGVPLIMYKSRSEVMLKSILADLNGSFPAGVGTLQFNTELSSQDKADMTLWNNRKFFGYKIVFSTLLSGASNNNNCGW